MGWKESLGLDPVLIFCVVWADCLMRVVYLTVFRQGLVICNSVTGLSATRLFGKLNLA